MNEYDGYFAGVRCPGFAHLVSDLRRQLELVLTAIVLPGPVCAWVTSFAPEAAVAGPLFWPRLRADEVYATALGGWDREMFAAALSHRKSSKPQAMTSPSVLPSRWWIGGGTATSRLRSTRPPTSWCSRFPPERRTAMLASTPRPWCDRRTGRRPSRTNHGNRLRALRT